MSRPLGQVVRCEPAPRALVEGVVHIRLVLQQQAHDAHMALPTPLSLMKRNLMALVGPLRGPLLSRRGALRAHLPQQEEVAPVAAAEPQLAVQVGHLQDARGAGRRRHR